jgi:Zn-dependent peptidase ImmA (M78 family)
MPAAHRARWSGVQPTAQIVRNIFEPEYMYLFEQVAKIFAPKFGVSVQAMRIRLEKLGLLHDQVPPRESLTLGS